jgi:hypothetical protein
MRGSRKPVRPAKPGITLRFSARGQTCGSSAAAREPGLQPKLSPHLALSEYGASRQRAKTDRRRRFGLFVDLRGDSLVAPRLPCGEPAVARGQSAGRRRWKPDAVVIPDDEPGLPGEEIRDPA